MCSVLARKLSLQATRDSLTHTHHIRANMSAVSQNECRACESKATPRAGDTVIVINHSMLACGDGEAPARSTTARINRGDFESSFKRASACLIASLSGTRSAPSTASSSSGDPAAMLTTAIGTCNIAASISAPGKPILQASTLDCGRFGLEHVNGPVFSPLVLVFSLSFL